MKGTTIAECKAELTNLREASRYIWEARKAQAYWWASLLHFLGERDKALTREREQLGIIPHDLILPPIVTVILRPKRRCPIREAELLRDAIEVFNVAWTGRGAPGGWSPPPISRYAGAKEHPRRIARLRVKQTRRLTLLENAGQICRQLEKALDECERRHLTEQLRIARASIPAPLSPEETYMVLKAAERRTPPKDDTHAKLGFNAAIKVRVLAPNPSDDALHAEGLRDLPADRRQAVEAEWTKWTVESSTWNNDLKAEAQRASAERQEWGELLGVLEPKGRSRTKALNVIKAAA